MTRKCIKCRKVRIPSDFRECFKCATTAVIQDHIDTLERLAIDESNIDTALDSQLEAALKARTLTLPTDSAARKEVPLNDGCLKYFPAALAGVARTSKLGNDKHNPGQPLHHARGKSMDHADCILRHLVDLQDLMSAYEKEQLKAIGSDKALKEFQNLQQKIKEEVSSLAWRALALSQELHEKFGAPLAPGAKLD